MARSRFTNGGRTDTKDKGGFVRGPWGPPPAETCCTHCGRVGMGQGEWNAPAYRCTHADFASKNPAASERELVVLWNGGAR